MKALVKRLLGQTFERYDIYKIYRLTDLKPHIIPEQPFAFEADTPDEDIATVSDGPLRSIAGYDGPEARVFTIKERNHVIAACAYWWGGRYGTRRIWDLDRGEAKLVQVNTDPAFKGRGLAPALIAASAVEMRAQCFTDLFARIWHNNKASIRAFEKAGWSLTAIVLHFKFKRGRAVRATVPLSRFAFRRLRIQGFLRLL